MRDFGEKITQDLKNAIKVQFKAKIKKIDHDEVQKDWLTRENELHEQFIENRTRLFIGRHEPLRKIKEYLSSDSNEPFAIIGETGSGKSSLLAKALQEYRQERENEGIIIAHFIGASSNSTHPVQMLRRFCTILSQKFHFNDERNISEADYFELQSRSQKSSWVSRENVLFTGVFTRWFK